MFVLSANGQMLASDVDDETAFVTLENADGTEWRCAACGEAVSEDVVGYTDRTGSWICDAYEPEDDPDVDEMAAASEVGDSPHLPQRVPLSWLNSARVHPKPVADEITLTVSVGEQGGVFAFTVRRVPDDAATNAGRLMLHMPIPEGPAPHAPLTPVRPGVYRVG